ncbi:MAG TPA: alpha/beta fold hydrolase [Thermoanaerobaculia bacterium]|nr:alpha/beta fold hydrolase [Thermoanaerobaculia bacterium]
MALGRNANHREPLTRLVRFEATDGIELVGLLYEPFRATKRAIVFLHGTGGASVFDSKRTNILADEFLRAGIAFFAFNNRGAHVLRRLRSTRRKRSISGGSAHEVIRDCVKDIDGALVNLRARGYRDFTLVGHSTGANKIAVYDHYKPRNPVKRYVLLAGGDDTGLLHLQLGEKRFRAAIEKARAMIKEKRGDELVSSRLSSMPMSWRAFYDMANPDGDYNVFPFGEVLRDVQLSRRARFRYVKAIRKPSLFVYGENDEYCYDDVPGCVAVLAEAIGANEKIELAIMRDADHGFGGREVELAALIERWMR